MLHLDRRLTRRGRLAVTAAGCALMLLGVGMAHAQGVPAESAPGKPQTSEPAWKTSPFHGVIGGDGNVIPCRCLFRGQAYRLGERVCMQTHVGTVMAECDLQQNNTSWIPTSEACTIS